MKITSTTDFSFLSDLSPDARNEIISSMTRISLPAGETLITEGDISDRFYLLESGKVDVFISNESGEQFNLATLHPGSHFGELSFIDGEKRSASVITLTDCDFLYLPQDEFKAILERNPKLYENLTRSLVKLIRQQNDSIKELAMNESYRKLSKYLNQNRSEMGGFRKSPPKLTVDSVSEATGIEKGIMIRLLDRLQTDHYLTVKDTIILNKILPDKL